MRSGKATPLQFYDTAVVSVTNATDATVSLADLLLATTGMRFSGSLTDQSKWKEFFGSAFPEIDNCKISLISSGAFTITNTLDQAVSANNVYNVAANTEKVLYVQNLKNIVILGTAVKVLIEF